MLARHLRPDRRFWLLALLLLLVGTLVLPAAQPLRVGVTPTLPPMVFKQGRQLVGIEVDLARALGQAIGRPIEFVELKWEAQIPTLLKGKTDIIMSSMSITRGRMFQINFSQPYLRVGQMALIRREDEGLYVLGFPSILTKDIGVKPGTTGDFLVQQSWPHANRRTYRTGEDAAKALAKKKIDLFVADGTLIWWLAGAYESMGVTAAPQLLSNEELAWGLRKDDPELLKQVDAFLADLEQKGELQKILTRWLPQAR